MTNWIPSPDLPHAPGPLSARRVRGSIVRSLAAMPPGRLRSDSGHDLDTATAAWVSHLHGRARDLRADADQVAAIDGAFRRVYTGRYPARADSSSYFALETTDRSGPIHERPLVPQQLLGAIPVENVDVSKEFYEVKFIDTAASVEVRTSGKTTVPFATVTADSSVRKMHVFHTGYMTGDWRHRQLAQSRSYSEDAKKAERCTWALDDFLSGSWLVSGADGLDTYHLGNLPVARETSANTYGSTAADTVLTEFTTYLQYFRETWKGSRSGATLRCNISPRIVHALGRYSNFAAGGDGLYRTQKVLDLIRGEGFEPTMVHEMYNLGGADTDGMMLFADYPDGLRHLVGMRSSVADSYQVGGSTVTEMAAISGGLICPDRQSCYIVNIPVVPAGE